MYSMGSGGDPRLEKYSKLVPNGLNRWIARHPLLTPAIGFAILGLLAAIDNLVGRPWGLLTPDYAASAVISSFQAFPHLFLPEMQELRGVENLRLLAK